jgi:hypothetical protein
MDIVRTGQRPFQFKLRSMLILTAMMAAVFGLVASCRNHLPKDPRGPVEDRAEWPISLSQFLADASAAGIDPEPVHVYLARVDWTERYYCWQMPSSPALLALMKQRWPLVPATSNDTTTFWRDMPAAWATRNTTNARSYLAWRRHPSDNLIVMIDGTANVVYVWYWFNF